MVKVMVFGSFDILHPGHFYFLKQAKKHGDFLVVVLARDITIEKIKGRKSVFKENQRKNNLEKLKIANQVVLGDLDDKMMIVKKENPQIICLGYDQIKFVDDLENLRAGDFEKVFKIVRLKPFKPQYYKSSILRSKK